MKKITILDSTLRDGIQGEGICFSLQDKINLALALDHFGIDFIEHGVTTENELEFFRKTEKLLHTARLCAFGRTAHPKNAEDPQIALLTAADTPVISIVGKTPISQVRQILNVAPEDNLNMISWTIRHFRSLNKEVILDAEHFFDSMKEDEEYTRLVLKTALEAGVSSICLCDTNGGSVPTEIIHAVQKAVSWFPGASFGIHTHNDCGCAVANSMVAVENGVSQIQGTFAGYGERCGNADLSILIPNLLLKKQCVCNVKRLDKLCLTATRVAEIANESIPGRKPYVGRSAFTHKGGMHADGMLKMPGAFEHVVPELVGNRRRYLVSEVAGRAAFLERVKNFAPDLKKRSAETTRLVEKMKNLELSGYQFEAADASFELMVLRELKRIQPHFQLIQYKTIGEYPAPDGKEQASAMIEVQVGSSTEISAAIGDGPVHALDLALRKALKIFYPQVQKVHLTDYKVRVLDSESATAAKVRVLIDSSDGVNTWTTVGVSTDIIEASWIALVDAIEYQLK